MVCYKLWLHQSIKELKYLKEEPPKEKGFNTVGGPYTTIWIAGDKLEWNKPEKKRKKTLLLKDE